MTSILALLAVFLLMGAAGGGGLRMRGSDTWTELTGLGLGSARWLCWAIPVGLLAFAASNLLAVWFPGFLPLPWWGALLLILGLEAGSVFGWWRSLSMGVNKEDGPVWQQWLRHTARGIVWGGFPALALWIVQGGLGIIPATAEVPMLWWLPLAAGAAVVVPYEIGRRIGPPDRVVQNGELGYGAMLGGSVGVAVCWHVLKAVT